MIGPLGPEVELAALVVTGPYAGPDTSIATGVITAEALKATDRAASHVTSRAVTAAWSDATVRAVAWSLSS
jgi:hypothetical protein